MMRILFLPLFLLLLLGCSKGERERLFEMTYPATDFDIPAGLSPSFPRVFERDDISTNIDFFLRENNLDTAQIARIQPFAARITALDNLDYDFVREISVRICEAGSDQCQRSDEVFYIDRLDERIDDVIELLPSLGNAKPELTRDAFKLEVVFFFRFTTPYSVRSRLDMTFEAVR